MEEICKKSKEYFGTTENIKEAGYILEDGVMLDFSGRRRQGEKTALLQLWDLKSPRGIDHREIKDIFPSVKLGADGTEEMIKFMRECKAIRVSGIQDLNLDFIKEITPQQEELLRKFEGMAAYIDIDDLNGIAICSKEFNEFSIRELKREINRCKPRIHPEGHIIIKNE